MKRAVKIILSLVLLIAAAFNLSGCLSFLVACVNQPSYEEDYLPTGTYKDFESVLSVGARDFTWYERLYFTENDKFFSEKYHKIQQKDIDRLTYYFETVESIYDDYYQDFGGAGKSKNGDIIGESFGFDYSAINTDNYYVEFHNQEAITNYEKVSFHLQSFDIMLYDQSSCTVHWIHNDT